MENVISRRAPDKLTRRRLLAGLIGAGGLAAISAGKVLGELTNRPNENQQLAKRALDKTPVKIRFIVKDNEDTRFNKAANVRNQPEAPVKEDGSLIGSLEVGQVIEGISWPGIDPKRPDYRKPVWGTWIAFEYEKGRGGIGFTYSGNLEEISPKSNAR